ncbi:MAG: hypothetical protein ABJB11_10405 [Ferruginibacter sp.]
MYKYAFQLVDNKKAAKQLVKDCGHKYNKNLAWLYKQKARAQFQKQVRATCFNWLHEQIKAIIQQEIDHQKLSHSHKTINLPYDEL